MIDIRIIIDSAEFCHKASKVVMNSHPKNKRIIACTVCFDDSATTYLLVDENKLIIMGEDIRLDQIIKLQRLVPSCDIELSYEDD